MSDVSLTFDGDRAYVELDRPDKHNGLTIDMLNDLVRVARVIGKRDEIRAVILAGNGPSFSSGLDIAKATGDPLSIVRNFLPCRGWARMLFRRRAGRGGGCRSR